MVPQTPASLLVARICTGAAPGSAITSAGSWISPPPPTTASTNPAASAAERRSSTGPDRRVVTTPVTLGWPACASSRCSRRPPRSCSRSGPGDDVVGVTFECDHPARRASRTIVSTSAMPEGLTPREIDAFVAEAMRARRRPLPPRRGRAGRPRRRPGGHPGPVRGLRRRRLGGRRRARPPRLHRRGADHRPAHARRGARRRSAPSARPPATRPRPPPLVASLRAPPRRRRTHGPRARPRPAGAACWSGPTRRSRRATGSPRWSTLAGGEPVLGTAGEKSRPGHLGRRPRRRARTWWCARRAATGSSGRAALAERARRRRGAARGGRGVGRRRQRVVRPPGPRLVDGVEALAGILHPDVVDASPIAARVR